MKARGFVPFADIRNKIFVIMSIGDKKAPVKALGDCVAVMERGLFLFVRFAFEFTIIKRHQKGEHFKFYDFATIENIDRIDRISSIPSVLCDLY